MGCIRKGGIYGMGMHTAGGVHSSLFLLALLAGYWQVITNALSPFLPLSLL